MTEAREDLRRMGGRRPRNRRHLVVPEVDLGDGNRVAARVEIDIEAGTIMIKKLRGRRFWKMPLSEAIGLAGRRAQLLAIRARGVEAGIPS